MIYPQSLQKGDMVAVVSPAGIVKPEFVEGACGRLREAGFEPVVMPHALGPASGSYAATAKERLADFVTAWNDPRIRAVLCARGGYGAVEIIGAVPPSMLRAGAKWLIGFSDISALHAMLLHAGVASLHAPMARHLATMPADDLSTLSLLRILSSPDPVSYSVAPHELNFHGEAEGTIVGGNLAVINGLAATAFDIFRPSDAEGKILFIEDIAEPIYKVERVLWRLHLAGTLGKIAGLIVGQFTEYAPDRNFSSMERMIHSRILDWGLEGIPVAFGFPAGHTDANLPIIEGSHARLTVTPDAVGLTMERL